MKKDIERIRVKAGMALRRASMAAFGVFASAAPSFAQTNSDNANQALQNVKDINRATDSIKNTLAGALTGILDVATIVVLIVAVPTLIWAYIRRTKGDHQGDDALIGWAWGAIAVILLLQAIRLLAGITG